MSLKQSKNFDLLSIFLITFINFFARVHGERSPIEPRTSQKLGFS
ncbi:hypothetical protein S7335_5006 [Synechococcus sp. PCC 7335]|nr:hypothetical protein S7335_5006 [Synechococcus sp. PCC 7335]